METRLIMLDSPILVSGETATNGDLVVYSSYIPLRLKNNNLYSLGGDWVCLPNQNSEFQPYRKIIAGLPDLPKLDLSLIADEIGWVDVEKLAYQAAEKSFKRGINKWENKGIVKFFIDTYIEGFKAAQSLNEKYSEEDLFNLLKMVHDKRLDSLSARIVDNGRVTDFNFWNSYSKKQVYASELISEFIQSISQPKEYLVEVSVENSAIKDFLGHPVISEAPKITNNTITVTKVLKQ